MFMRGTPFFACPTVITTYYIRKSTIQIVNVIRNTIQICNKILTVNAAIRITGQVGGAVWRCRGGLGRLSFACFRLESRWRVWFNWFRGRSRSGRCGGGGRGGVEVKFIGFGSRWRDWGRGKGREGLTVTCRQCGGGGAW